MIRTLIGSALGAVWFGGLGFILYRVLRFQARVFRFRRNLRADRRYWDAKHAEAVKQARFTDVDRYHQALIEARSPELDFLKPRLLSTYKIDPQTGRPGGS